MNPHEKQLRLRVAELRRIDDVAAMFDQKAGYAMDDAALIETGQDKNIFRMHGDYGYFEKRSALSQAKEAIVARLDCINQP
jgi:hypothetical protein